MSSPPSLMETYQTLFPSSSSSSTITEQYPSSNMVMNFHVFSDLHHGNNSNNNNNGYFALKSENIVVPSHGNTLPGLHHEVIKSSSKQKSEKKVRNHRYAFQTRSQVDILDDGYRWRKYGQKAVKNNKHPRSYYRCTHHGCNVKKQVQRLSKDEGVVVTTYEGMHTHPIEKSTDNFEHILSQMQINLPRLQNLQSLNEPLNC